MTYQAITIPTLKVLGETFTNAVMSFGEYPEAAGMGVTLTSAVGEPLDTISVNLVSSYGLAPDPGMIFIPNDKREMIEALKEAGVVTLTGRVVTYGPFNSTASEAQVHSPR